MRPVQYLLLLLFLLLAVTAHPQVSHLKFAHIGTESGLSQSNVTCILRDRQGFMWFGTRDGLNKYDGYGFVVYKNDPDDSFSLSSNFVTSIIEDRKGDIWVGTWGGGLDRFDKAKAKFVHYGSRVHSDFVNTLLQDSRGMIWIGSTDHGAWTMDPGTGKLTSFAYNPANPGSLDDNDVQSVLEDSRHQIWLGTSHGGLNLFDRKSGSFRRFRHDAGDPGSLAGDQVQKVFEDSRHRLWVGMRDGGLDLYQPDNGSFRHFRHDPGNGNSLANNVVLALEEDDKGNLWIGTENDGVSILDADLQRFSTYAHDDIDNTSLTNNSIYSLYRDPQGNMWVGTYDGGINLFNKGANQFIHYKHTSSPESLANNHVLDILEDQGHLWVGTDGGGLDAIDRRTGLFTHFTHTGTAKNEICGNYVLSLYEDDEGELWAGTWGNGITVMSQDGKVIRQFQHAAADSGSLGGNNVYSIAEDHHHTIWVATYGEGLSKLDARRRTFQHFRHDAGNPNSPGSDRLHTLMADSDDVLWIGTFDGGLDRLDERTGQFTHYIHEAGKNSLSNNTINYVYADSHGNLWVCTADGLNCLDRRTGHFTVYLPKDGLPSAVIFGILEDNAGDLWVSTNNGLSRFNPRTHAFKNYSTADGLQSDQFKAHACCKGKSGELYFGGVNGFNQFFPDSIRENPFDPPLLITGFEIFNREVPIGSGKDAGPLTQDITMTRNVTISYKSSVISFEFASLNYTVPEKKHYAYMLEGFDKGWNDIGAKRTATYTNLDPGTYTFRVRGWNNDGSWSPTLASLGLTVTPPFWQAWWFRVLAAVCIVAIVLALHLLRLNAIRAQKKKLENEVDHRTRQLALSRDDERRAREQAEKANRAKSEFMANISHELRTPMNAIIGFTDLVLTTELEESQRDYLKNVHRSGYNLLGIINDILDYSKIEAGKLTIENTSFCLCQLVEETVDSLAIKAFEKKLELICETDPSLPLQVMGDPVRIQQVLINLLGNAIKFTEKGEVVVALEKGAVRAAEDGRKFQTVQLSVKDTGIGIPAEKLQSIFESFTQADSSTTRKYGGTGLGLTIARNLAEMMGGELSVTSKAGKGSVFSLRLDMEIVNEKASVALTQRQALRRVLVVDDNVTNCQLMQNIFGYMGIECRWCTGGAEALEILENTGENELFDLIVTDHQMPEMDGITLVGKIKQSLQGRRQPFILMLSSLDKGMCVQEAGEAGIDLFLSKPVKLQELNSILQSIFGHEELHRAGGAQKPEIKKITEHASVLVAEDEPVNMLLISEVLLKMGFSVIKASNGKQALELLASHRPTVILMDVNMPEMDGLEATRLIRGLPEPQRHIPIIALTAGAMKEDRERCLGAGMNSFISKPFRLEEIEGVLAQYVARA